MAYPKNAKGIPFGEFCVTTSNLPCRIAGRSDRTLSFVETWSPYLFGSTELGDTYTSDLTVIPYPIWKQMVLDLGYSSTGSKCDRLRAYDKEQEAEMAHHALTGG